MTTPLRTLRFKVAGAFLLWTALFQVALALVIPLARDRVILSEIDAALAAEAERAMDGLAAGKLSPEQLVGAMPGGREDPVAGGMVYQVSTPEGLIGASAPLRRAPLQTPRPAPGQDAGVRATVAQPGTGPSAGRYRTLTFEVARESAPPLYVTVAASLQAADWLGRVVRWIVLVALIPGLAGAAVAGWIVAGITATRIERIADSVRSISANHLDQRLHVGGDDEIAAMAADINAMLDRLASTISGLERFMSEVSHELKTPVSALLAEAQVMKYAPPTAETAAKFILSVEDEMRRLGKLVESFLMLARFEHGRRYVAEASVHVNDVVLESVEHSSRLASQSEVALNLTLYDAGTDHPEAIVKGDAELLRTVFDNLLRNAVQFSDRGSAISVAVGVEGDRVTVAIRDRGPGAPPEHINRIFERYVQAPNQKPGRRGTGLGLAIARGIVELHHGSIAANNHPEGGCVFTVTLPLAQPRPAPPTSLRAVATR